MALRFGVAGTAYWASEIHLPGLLATEGADVVGIWGRTPETVATIAARHGIRAFPRFEDLLAEVDAVTMAVPPDVQARLALAAARAGRHMIVEKPLTREPRTARAIATAVADRNLAALVFFLRRFVPEVEAAITAERDHPWTHADIRVHSYVMAQQSPYINSVWRQQQGAALWDIGPHVLSVLIPMLGIVTAVEGIAAPPGFSRFRTTHARGATADVSLSLHVAPADICNEYRFTSATRDIVLPNPEIGRVGAFSQAVQDLLAAVASGRRDHPCSVGLGADIVDILARAEQP
jgi:predicted dehydrogenase